MRRIECLKYAECLGEAAKRNKPFNCDGCKDYECRDPTEEEETMNIREKGEEEATIMETKMCTKCGKEKNIEDFNKGSNKDGKKSMCRQCEAEYFQEYKKRKAAGKVRTRKAELRKRVIRNVKKAVEKTKAAHTSENVYKTGTDDKVEQVHVALAPAADRAQLLAEEHWAYISGLIAVHNQHMSPEETKDMKVLEFHYKTAMVHGYKHGQQDAKG